MNNQDVEQWNIYADLYSQGKRKAGDKLHNTLIKPILDDFLGDYAGLTILDAGCGNGFLTDILGEKAKEVVGIDSSEQLLCFSRQNVKKNNIFFKSADLTKKLELPDDYFDIVIANMVLQYLPNLRNFVAESSRILQKQGRLIVIIDHPSHALFLRAQELVGRKNEKFIDTAGYFQEGLRKKISLWDKAILQYYHRTLNYYFNNFTEIFRLHKISEMSDDDEMPRILGLCWINGK